MVVRLYFLEMELKEMDKSYFYGCSKSRSVIEKKRIPETEYVFAIQKKKTGVWEIKHRDYKPAKLLISKTLAEYHIPALRPPLSLSSVSSSSANESCPPAFQEGEKEPTTTPMSPPLLDLDEEEKFRDQEGNVVHIEVRGERHFKKCFFLVKDVSKAFEIHRLYETLTHHTSSYEKNVHFLYFIRSDTNNNVRKSNEKLLYLTYHGMLKVLFSSRTGTAESFQEWATEKLFTMQMGSEEDRDALAGELIGVSPKTIHDVFRRNTEKTPCIYLIQISTNKQMFGESLNNDDLICKYGFTDDLPRRIREHTKYFQEQKKVGYVRLLCFSIIDPKFISDAESRLSRLFRHFHVSYENQTEFSVFIITRHERDSTGF